MSFEGLLEAMLAEPDDMGLPSSDSDIVQPSTTGTVDKALDEDDTDIADPEYCSRRASPSNKDIFQATLLRDDSEDPSAFSDKVKTIWTYPLLERDPNKPVYAEPEKPILSTKPHPLAFVTPLDHSESHKHRPPSPPKSILHDALRNSIAMPQLCTTPQTKYPTELDAPRKVQPTLPAGPGLDEHVASPVPFLYAPQAVHPPIQPKSPKRSSSKAKSLRDMKPTSPENPPEIPPRRMSSVKSIKLVASVQDMQPSIHVVFSDTDSIDFDPKNCETELDSAENVSKGEQKCQEPVRASSVPTPSDPVPIASVPTPSEPTASEPTASESTASEPTASEPTASEPTASEPLLRKKFSDFDMSARLSPTGMRVVSIRASSPIGTEPVDMRAVQSRFMTPIQELPVEESVHTPPRENSEKSFSSVIVRDSVLEVEGAPTLCLPMKKFFSSVSKMCLSTKKSTPQEKDLAIESPFVPNTLGTAEPQHKSSLCSRGTTSDNSDTSWSNYVFSAMAKFGARNQSIRRGVHRLDSTDTQDIGLHSFIDPRAEPAGPYPVILRRDSQQRSKASLIHNVPILDGLNDDL